MINTPIVRLQVEGLAQSMTFAVAQYNKDIEAMIADGIKKEMVNFDYGAVIQREVQEAIKKRVASSVNAYFSFGKGMELIDGMVNDILNEAVEKTEDK